MNPQLKGRKLYVPEMDYGGARVLAASFRHTGIDAQVVPQSNSVTLKKGFACTSGEECFPQQVTMGDFIHLLDEGVVAPEKAAFFMPTATGPCRFGQYAQLIKNILNERGYTEAVVYSLTSENGYADVGGISFIRRVWWGIVAADVLRKTLHRIRPYENNEGETDKVYYDGIKQIEDLIASDMKTDKHLFNKIADALKEIKKKYQAIEIHEADYPLIGVIGEIFCRLNTFSNNDLIRKLEKMGAEIWLAGVAEWILYTGVGERHRLVEEGHKYSKKMVGAILKDKVIKKDEHKLTHIYADILKGREDEPNIEKLLEYSEPYLPSTGALGEMTLGTANAIHFYHKGAAGIIDISPFSCMNGIVAEAVYPRVSRDYGGLPIRIFYFDGTQSHLDRDLGIFLQLANNFRKKG